MAPVDRFVRIACACLALAGLTPAAEPDAVLRIPRVGRAPKLSDFVDNTPREAEAAVSNFTQFDPDDGAPASQATTAYLSYDDRNLYVAFVCMDDPARIRARVARRKDIMSDDRVTINLDTFHDHKRAYFFDVNPYAVQMDGITTDGQGDDFSFETLWYTEARILQDRYIVLETIPFRSLRFPPGAGGRWGIGLFRFIQRNNEMAGWPHVSRKGLPKFVGQFADMEGPEQISPGRNLQFVPYTAASKSRLFEAPAGPGAPGEGYRNDHEIRGGLDAKAVLRDALTLDFTVNPDFSQVESDEPQVTVNQRYEVFFPERRPFFTENAGLFETPENLFFSRRIVDPQFGGRLTGKVGRWALAALAADDRGPGEVVSADDPLSGDRALNGVARVAREFGRQSSAGVLFSDREFGGGWNRVAAADTRLLLPANWSLRAQAARSFTQDREGGPFSAGQAIDFSLARNTTHVQYSTTYVDRSPQFRSDLGYIDRVDIRRLRHTLGYRWRPAGRTLLSYGPFSSFMSNHDHAGRLQDWKATTEFDVELVRRTMLIVEHEQAFERYQNIGFRKHSTVGFIETEWFRWMALHVDGARRQSINYYPAAGFLPFTAREQSGTFRLTLRPTARLRFDQAYLFTRLAARQTVFNDHVARAKVNYQFTRALSLRAIFDYHGVLPNPALVALDRTKRIGADLLFTWLVHPGTAIYAGYNSGYENFSFDPLRSPAWRRTGMPDGLQGRQVFIKLSYMFRY